MQRKIAWLLLFCLASSLAACGPGAVPAAPSMTALPSPSPLPLPAATTAIATQFPPGMPGPPAPGPSATPLQFLMPTCAWCAQQTATALAPTFTLTPPGQPASVKVEKLDVWDDPAQENSYWHRQTQLITGERVTILAESGAWAQIVAVDQPSSKEERGYPGWVRLDGLVPGWSDAPEFATVRARTTLAYEKPASSSARLMRLYLDVRLPVVAQDPSWVQVLLPDGRKAWLTLADVSLSGDAGNADTLAALLRTARSLQVAPYVWGGTTTDSPDCSGFIYRLFHAYGIQLARDADDQEKMYGTPVVESDLQVGDLIYYSDVIAGPVTHVGLYMGAGQIMDANPFFGLSIHPLDQMLRYYFFHSIRRVIPPGP